MDQRTAILNAHVQFELDRWRADALGATVEEECAALLDWLQTVPLADLVSPEQITGWIMRVGVEMPISEGLVRALEEGVKAAVGVLRTDETRVDALLKRASFDQATEIVVGMKGLRRELTRQLTSSAIYAMLVSNVLYDGIKSFLLTENVLTRNIPGASSLLRMGQNALNSAAPNLEKGVDKQLVAFIQNNAQETLRNSEHYLNKVLDDTQMWQIADEVWNENAGRSVASLTQALDKAALVDMIDFARNVWLHVRQTPLFASVAEAVVQEFFRTHGAQSVGALLEEMGVTRTLIVREAQAFAPSLVDAARNSGYLEARIRRRLEPFYDGYFAGV
ncbi:MAG: hypothetical protein ACRC1H_16660 [Caldilineaceae bacterium]